MVERDNGAQAGQIHGLISREDAWRMWKPYGERVVDELDGSLDPDTITPGEAEAVVYGAHESHQWNMYQKVADKGEAEDWLQLIRAEVENGADGELLDLLVEANDRQNQVVAAARERALNLGPRFAAKMVEGARLLTGDLWSDEQASLVAERQFGPDGQPYMQYTPMTQLEYHRLAVKYDGEEPDPTMANCTDYSLGVIRSAYHLETQGMRVNRHNRVHEQVHASVAGVEIHDITREDGWRHPEATVIGHFAYEPTPKIIAGDDYSNVENVEANEGYTDMTAQAMMAAVRGLKTYRLAPSKNSYMPWVDMTRAIYRQSPEVAKEITHAALIDATPANPTAKREALARMHDTAKRAGLPLDPLFKQHTTILDIYTKGKREQ